MSIAQQLEEAVGGELVEGRLAWGKTNALAKKFGGALDKSYKQKSAAAHDTKWVFQAEDGYRQFVKSMKNNHMSLRADPETMSVVIAF